MSIVSVDEDPKQLEKGGFDRKFDTKKDTTTSDFDEQYGTKMNNLIIEIKKNIGVYPPDNKIINNYDYDFLYKLRQNELIKYNNDKRFQYYALLDGISNCVSFQYTSEYSKDKQFIYSQLYPVVLDLNEFVVNSWFRFIHIRFPNVLIRDEYFKWMRSHN